jgi:hypothetical protein
VGEITLQASKKVSSRSCQVVGLDSKQIKVSHLARILPSAMEMASSPMVSTKLDPVTIPVLQDLTNITSSRMSKARNENCVVVESVQSN